MTLDTPVEKLPRAGKAYAEKLEKLNIFTFGDLLLHIPSRYENFSIISPIGSIQEGETVTIIGTVEELKNSYISKFKTIQRGVLVDDTGRMNISWFNQPFLTKNIQVGDTIAIAGRVEIFAHKLSMQSPDYEKVIEGQELIHTGRLVPVYPETRGVTSKWLRKQIYTLLLQEGLIKEFMPENIIQKYHLSNLNQAYQHIHFPQNFEEVATARKRLAFDELLTLQLKSLQKREEWKVLTIRKPFEIIKYKKQITKLKENLPFSLTGAQESAINDIFHDMEGTTPMNRLLQGDVGSGKTIVASITMYMSFLNGFQSVLMAPTEILAQQHFTAISRLLTPLGVTVGLATGSKKELIDTFDILIGTHAVLSEKITYTHLGLVVIDEQQRFGVEQRGLIRQKGENPHLLTMTATPIPRTVALTLYGNLDLSFLHELPKGRKVIKTWLVPPEKREGAYNWIRQEITEHNSQVFIICPLIEESENMATVKAASKEHEFLQKEIFPELKLGLLHGRIKAKEKETILQAFRDKEYDILVATPVVEVGIDIPNATVIMIEASERFGLSQLHQLRGRVGRGDKQSYCLLFTEATNDLTLTRLRAMESIQIGGELAELDLRLRGAGDMYGTMQHGRTFLRIASFSDSELIAEVQVAARALFEKRNEYPFVNEKINTLHSSLVTPD
jgi:ATP-dependent DNA helicase RecG